MNRPDTDVLCCQPDGEQYEDPYLYRTRDGYGQTLRFEFLDERLTKLFLFLNTTPVENFVLADPRLVLDDDTGYLIKLRYWERDVAMHESGFIPVEIDGVESFQLLYEHQSNPYNPVHNDDYIDTFEEHRFNNRHVDDPRKVMGFLCPVHGRRFHCRIHERRWYGEGTMIRMEGGEREWQDTTEEMERQAIAAGFNPSEES
jgi:hypothetical protein